MNPTDRQLIFIADLIRQQLQSQRRFYDLEISLPFDRFRALLEELNGFRRKLRICQRRELYDAARRLHVCLIERLEELPSHTAQIKQATKMRNRAVPALRELVADLQQARAEFGGLRYQAGTAVLSASTESIQLEGVHLGEFTIELILPQLGEGPMACFYRIVALDPHPAAANPAITHPHVSDEKLCAGDGSAAIQAALLDGRICDAFLLIRAVLTTYNPDSVHVRLEDWEGVPCEDCGYVTSQDNRFYCETCRRDYCDECIGFCQGCEEAHCRNCLEACPLCAELCCQACQQSCPACDQLCCISCLDQKICSTCKTKEIDHEEGQIQQSNLQQSPA